MQGFELLVLAAIFMVAVLYSSVGHGGGSGYLAVMAFFAVAPNITKPTALALNIFVAGIATIQFYRRGHFSWKIFVPFAAASIPFAFIGGMVELPIQYYKLLLGISLILAAARLAWDFSKNETLCEFSWLPAVSIGAIIGLTSGLIGIGGGVFLTPILLLMRWTDAKTAAGISALFILVNSISALTGNFRNAIQLPTSVWVWIITAIIGGIIGSTLGSKYFNSLMLRRTLSIVLLVAGVKLILV